MAAGLVKNISKEKKSGQIKYNYQSPINGKSTGP